MAAESATLTGEIAASGAVDSARANSIRANDGWPDPVNLHAELAAPAYEATDLPPTLATYPTLYSMRTGIDPSITLMAATIVAATALSDGFCLEADASTGWRQPSRLWGLPVGPPGSGKTPGMREMAAPLWAINGELRKAWESECAACTDDDQKPALRRALIGDTTIEALSEALRANPQGLGIFSDEFESWLGSMDTYRKGGASRDRGEWLRLFDGGPHTIERVQRGSVFVPNWGVSIFTATTPAALRKLARHLPEDGLLQRFLIAIARRQCMDTQATSGIEVAREAYRVTVHRLYAARPRAHNGIVTMSSAAMAAFQAWRRENLILQEALGSIEPALESHLAKHPTLLLRVALTFHAACIVNLEHEDARDVAAYTVPIETMETAIRFMRRAGQHAMALFFNVAGRSEVYELAADVSRAILVAGRSTIERRDLQAKVHAFRTAEPATQDAALRLLCDTGWLRSTAGGYAKARPTRYEISPRLAGKYAALAVQEQERRLTVRRAIAEATQEKRDRDA